MFPRPLRTLAAVACAAALAGGLVACGDDDDSGSSTEEPATTAATTSAAPAAGTVQLTTSDGVDITLDLESCSSDGETDLTLRASSETADLSVEATAGTGPVMLTSADGDREGRADSVTVGDDGEFTATGPLTLADDTAEPATFELTGNCGTAGGLGPVSSTVSLTTSDGVDLTLEIQSCETSGDSDLTLTASTETADLTVAATGGTGPVKLDAPDGDREGRADSVTVDDDGDFTATGPLTLADDTAQPATFELTGNCGLATP